MFLSCHPTLMSTITSNETDLGMRQYYPTGTR
jgi:hypothetical protein